MRVDQLCSICSYQLRSNLSGMDHSAGMTRHNTWLKQQGKQTVERAARFSDGSGA